ncbi:FAD/NAD(P)-binding protein [Kordia jejudonensis]|uniref:FAD/NAD(P)-binding protein n=1 Tax=Kordia jejudonensis TaxID=1348245 RepID=UPI0006297997|nr:FAD/NAD(P)-binding protein [Kordia jejudonensis]
MEKSITRTKRNITIIGIGPRGGYALENFILSLEGKTDLSKINLLLFEQTGNFGNGSVYETTQIESNWINIPERILLLEKRATITFPKFEIPSFPSYHDWIETDFEKKPKKHIDHYPPRAKIGRYLQQRFQSIITPLVHNAIVTLIESQVEEVIVSETYDISLKTDAKVYKNIDEILLTIGHQPTELSEQLLAWKKFASNKSNVTLFTSPYPIVNFLNHQNVTDKSIVGLRGFGLAMIDVARAISMNFGEFTLEDSYTRKCSYQPNKEYSGKMIPFSLDGLPAVPKPLNALMDDLFKPTETQLSDYTSLIGNPTTQKNASSPEFLLKAFAPIAAKIYLQLKTTFYNEKMSLEETENTIIQWLKDPEYKHASILPNNQPVKNIMQDFVAMATGNKPISLDFCVGQVWRHCQPSMYTALSFNACHEDVFAEIIALDESTKRYSYGPPVESIQQMIALIEAGKIDTKFLSDPDFELTDDGWNFHNKSHSETATIMINSVLDPPKIKVVKSPIIENLLSSDLIQMVHDDLGIMTDEQAYVISENEDHFIPIALLGRLAKGTIIGVDAILECYGERPKNWAEKASNRHVEALRTNDAT